MKIHEHITVFLTLLLTIRGMTGTDAILEGETFNFNLPDVPHGSNITSIEWRHKKDKSTLLAIINADSGEIQKFAQRSRLEFLKNGSIYIRDVQQEDAGNYTCKIVFESGRTETYEVSLTLYSETSQSPSYNSTRATLGNQPASILKIAIPVTCGVLGLVLLGGVILIIFKCRKKRSISVESIYANMQYIKEQQPKKSKRPK
ncbi:uncharacterized protein LOC118810447 isoform X1 [Colossoma macropomum]|uniref:uncharacterized protein LOC118810447 isoform X1 n=1 Tax=Colossoma macropomum TaxID=42526 RepID=UPI00186563C1|nr:uncharacterized protein LOC118810447 isoform X1 [Colossoma macropomum]